MSGLQYESGSIKPDEGKAVITAVKHYRESKGKYHPPQDTKAYQRHLSKLLLNIESDEVYDRIQRKKELEKFNRAQDEKRKEEAKQQQKTRLEVLQSLKPRQSFMAEMLPGRAPNPQSPFLGLRSDTPQSPVPGLRSDTPKEPFSGIRSDTPKEQFPGIRSETPKSPFPSIFESTISSSEDMKDIKMDTLEVPRAHVSTPPGVHNISELPEAGVSEVLPGKLNFTVVSVSPRPKTQ